MHGFGLFGPVQLVYSFKQLFRVIGYAEEPLSHFFSYYFAAATFAFAVNHLFVCDDGVAGRTPVDGRQLLISQSVLVKLNKQPLRPLVIFGRGGVKFRVPIEHRTHVFQLTFHRGYIFHRAVKRMNTRLYSVVFGRQTERVEAHRLENVVAFHALITRVRIGKTVVVPMPQVQICARGVGEHFESVIFFLFRVVLEGVNFVLRPDFVPFFFDCFIVHNGVSV